MATDDDTTPVALRAALLRSDTTPERPKAKKKQSAQICSCLHLRRGPRMAPVNF
jgi:hypothetical protein